MRGGGGGEGTGVGLEGRKVGSECYIRLWEGNHSFQSPVSHFFSLRRKHISVLGGR